MTIGSPDNPDKQAKTGWRHFYAQLSHSEPKITGLGTGLTGKNRAAKEVLSAECLVLSKMQVVYLIDDENPTMIAFKKLSSALAQRHGIELSTTPDVDGF